MVAEQVNVSINHYTMLKVEGSNLSISILKFVLFQFSKWLHLDKNNNLGILVGLLVLMIDLALALTLRSIYSRFMAYKWTMAMQLFEYCIDPKNHKSGEEHKAIAVKGAIWPKSLIRCQGDWLFQPCQMEEYHLSIKTLQLLFLKMTAHHLLYRNMCLDLNKLIIHPIGMIIFKKLCV